MNANLGKVAVWLSLLLTMTAAAQENSSEPTFRTGTGLVQLSIIAQDKNGKAVTDLRREDFQIFDNGAPQKVALFLGAQSIPAQEVALPAGVFTNQIATGTGTGYSALLFDNLNIDPARAAVGYTARARQMALKAYEAIPPGDSIAIYSLWCQFQVVREFTSDRDSLLQQLKKFSPAATNCIEGGDGPEHALTERVFHPGANANVLPATDHGDFGSIASSIQADIGDNEFKQLAEHLAGIPGRKNLIWLTSTFRLKPSNLQKLINANVAVYPVDTAGSVIGLEAEKEARYAGIRALAALTGGKAYVDRDDLDAAIGDALNDGHVSYTLGFYRPDADQKAAIHRIEVRTKREGVVLRYRTSYAVEAPKPKSTNPVQDMIDALNRPVNATAIAMMASATRSTKTLKLTLLFDISGLELQQKNGYWEGQTELVARFLQNDGKRAGNVTALTMRFHLRPATYAAALEHGYRIHREIEIPAKAADLNLLLGSVATGKIGTVTIPMAQVK